MKTFKRIACLLLSVLICCAFAINGDAVGGDIIADETVELQTGNFTYPITVESPDWFDYSVKEKVAMLSIPDDILAKMSNDQLIAAVTSYPYLVDIYLYGNNVSDGITVSRRYFSALDELLNRDDGMSSLYAHCVAAAATLTNCTTEISSDDQFELKALIDIHNALSSTQSNASTQSVYFVYTPMGNPVQVFNPPEVHTVLEHQADVQETMRTYGVELVADGTCDYNCHYFAWHKKGSLLIQENAWMNDPSKYMTDLSYFRKYLGSLSTIAYTTSIQPGDVIFYGDVTLLGAGDLNTCHSAILKASASTGAPLASLQCMSKWGPSGVYLHAMGNVPAEYDTSTVSAWRLNS